MGHTGIYALGEREEMKEKELEMAIRILQRTKAYYSSLFDKNGEVKWLTGRNQSKTQAKQEIVFVRRLLLEVEKEL